MATLKEIKTRITGVQNTQQITKAMKMVAAARLRRAQENMINARPYSRKISEVLSNLMKMEKNISNPLIEQREFNRVAIITITSDRGLCGGFNMNIIRETERIIKADYAEQYASDNLELYCVGKKGMDYFSKRNFIVSKGYAGVFSKLEFSTATSLIAELKQRFIDGEIDKVVLVYNEFKSVAQQNLMVEQLFPVQADSIETTEEELHSEYIFEPNKVQIINDLIPKYLNSMMWKSLLESYAAELGARMSAMDMATENAKELISSLQLTYNKERQAAITKEILEIVSGANALKKA